MTETISQYLARMNREQQRQRAAAASIVVSNQTVSPDDAARDMQIANDFSSLTGGPVPPLPMVTEFRPVFEQQIEQRRASTILASSPKLAEWLRDPTNAALARDDLEGLSSWERIAQSFDLGEATAITTGQDMARDTATALERGPLGRGLAAAGQAFDDALLTGEDGTPNILGRLANFARGQGQASDGVSRRMVGGPEVSQDQRADEIASNPMGAMYEGAQAVIARMEEQGFSPMSYRDVGGVGSALQFVAENLAMSLPQMGAAIASGGLSPIIQVLTLGGEANAELKEKTDLSLEDRVAIATGAGVLMAGLDYVGLGAIFRGVPAGAVAMEALDGTIVQRLMQHGFTEAAGRAVQAAIVEGSTEALQEAIVMGATAAGGGEYSSEEVLDRLVQAFTAGGGVGGALRGGMEAVQAIERRQREAATAEQRAEVFRGLAGQAANSRLRQRMPEAFQRFLTQATAGGPVENLYVPAKEFAEYFQSKGLDPFQVAASLEGVDDLAAALATGGDIRVPTATWAGTMAGGEHDAFMLENMRLRPDEMTAKEAKEFQSTQGQAMAEAMAEVDRMRSEESRYEGLEQQIYDQVVEGLTQAGRSPDVAASEAMLYPAFYRTMSARMGMTVEEMLERYPLPQVRGTLPQQQDELTTALGEARRRASDPLAADEDSAAVEQYLASLGVSLADSDAVIAEAVRRDREEQGRLYGQDGEIATESEAFKRWFGGSAVVDAEGRPLVVYHGTQSDFQSFYPLSHFGTQAAARDRIMGTGGTFPLDDARGERTLPVYLNIKKPLRVSEHGGSWSDDNDMMESVAAALRAEGMEQEAATVEEFIEEYDGATDYASSAAQLIREAGFDGLVYENRVEDVGQDSWVALSPTQIKSVFNRGTFDPQDPRILFQSGLPLLDQPLSIQGKVTVRAIAEAMNADHLAKHGRQFFPETDEADYTTILEMVRGELQAQLAQENSGVGWYSTDVALSIELASEVFPTLATDPDHRDLFLTFAGLFSNGNTPEQAFMLSAEAFEAFLATGMVPVSRAEAASARSATVNGGWSVRNKVNEQQLQFVRQIIEREGGLAQGIAWLRTPQPRAEINRAMTESGLYKAGRYTTKKDIAGPDAYGIMAFGEKLGRYTMGLHGVDIDAGDTTIDLWYIRTYRRMVGRLLETPLDEATGVVGGPNDRDREVIFRMTGDLVNEFDLPAGDVQAVLWFFEKRLWGAQGLRTSEGTNSSGARKLLRSRGVDDGAGGDVQGLLARIQDAAGREFGQGPAERGTGRQGGSLAPLEGAPLVQGASGPDPRLVAVAEDYARSIGITLRRQAEFVEVDAERATRIAAAYEAMPHAPQDPAVREAYANLIEQTVAQYRALEAAGYQFWFFDDATDPYEGNPWNAMRDLRANQTMAVYATEAGFGSGATELNVDDNPMLADTGIEWGFGAVDGPRKRVLANDLFRAVHDAFGHGLEGAGFRARGEENAWQAHVRLFTGSAVAAITSETRGQNSWLNYGPYGEQNRTAGVGDTVFADQKTGLMPEWTWTEGRAGDAQEETYGQAVQEAGRGVGAGAVRAPGAGTGAGSAGNQGQSSAQDGDADRPVSAEDLERIEDPAAFAEFLRRPGWAVLTGTNESLPEAIRETRNRENNEYLRTLLQQQGIPHVEVAGMYKGVDQGISFLIVADEATSLRLGRQFEQESILTRDGLVYSRPIPATPATGEVLTGEAALAEEFYSITPGGAAFSMGLDFDRGPGVPVIPEGYTTDPTRPQLPIRADGMVELHHWSDKVLTTVDPQFAGSGPLAGAERRRGAKLGFFGINPRQSMRDAGTGYVKENRLGANEHVALVDARRLYPWFEDPDGLVTGDVTASERAIREAGYLGYYVTDDGSGAAPLGNVAALFEAVPVVPADQVTAARAREYAQPAYHGSPHLFERFSLEKIGTGEGNQAFGWGLYFAGRRQVAEWYRDTLATRTQIIMPNGETVRGRFNQEALMGMIEETLTERGVYDGLLAELGGRLEDVVYDIAESIRQGAAFSGFGVTQAGKRIEAELKAAGWRRTGVAEFRGDDGVIGAADLAYRYEGEVLAALQVFNLPPRLADHWAWYLSISAAEAMIDSRMTGGALKAAVRAKVESADPPKNADEEAALEAALSTIDALVDETKLNSEGRLFEVDVPDDSELMDWDAPLSEQPEGVRDAVVGVLKSSTKVSGADADYDGLKASYAYRTISNALGSPRAASEALRAAGIPGHRYLDGTSRRAGDGSYNFVIYDEDRINVLRFEQERRGSIQTPAGGMGNGQAVINLFGSADLSTFLHESGHFFLLVLQDMAQRGVPVAQQEVRVLRDWWRSNASSVAKDAMRVMPDVKITEADVIAALDNGTTGDVMKDAAVDVGMQEQAARAFEAYLMEGKAPSEELRGVFSKFRAWLLSVYRRLAGLNVTPSPEIVSVFDRMLAGDQEIATAKQRSGDRGPLFKDAAEASMPPEDYARYREIVQAAEDEAEARLVEEAMRPIRRQEEKWYREERAAVAAEVEAETNTRPVYRAIEWMGNRRWLGEDQPQGLGDFRLSKDILVERYGVDALKGLPRGQQTIYALEGGLDPDEAAGWFGFRSGDEMVRALQAAQPRKAAIQAETDRRMEGRHPDSMKTGAIAEAALEAVHGDKRARVLALELEVLNARPGGTRSAVAVLRETARRTLAGMQVRDAINAGRFLAAERRAGEEAYKAFTAGDLRAAADAKRRQLMNHLFYGEARKIADEVQSAERLAQRLGKKSIREKLAGDYLEAIDELLTRYDFRKLSARAEDRRGGLLAYVERMKAEGRENELAIPDRVMQDAQRTPYKRLTVEHLRGVVDSLRNIEHTARLKQKLIDAQSQRDLDRVVESILEAFDANVQTRPPGRVSTAAEGRRRGVRGFFNLILNATTLLREIDGFQYGGAAYENIKAPIDAAMNRLSQRRERAAVDLDRLYEVYTKAERRRMAVREFIPEINDSMSRWERIAVALNMGNDGNYQRLTDDRVRGGFTEAQVKAIVAGLDERDARFVQSVWDYLETFRADVAAREKRVTGVEPKWVEARPVTIAGIALRGGYYPLRYDPRLSAAARDDQAQEIAASLQAGRFGKAQTRNGHLKERAQSSGRGVELDISVLHKHVQQVVYDLELSEPVSNAWRIIQDKRVRSAFIDTGKQADFDALETWLKDVAEGEIRAGDAVSRQARRFKSNFTAAKLAFNLGTVAVQVTGLAQSMVVVGKKDFLSGVIATLRPGVFAEVVAKSEFMRQRQTTFNKDIYDLYEDPRLGPVQGRWTDLRNNWIAPAGFWLMTKVQFYLVDTPTWIAGYEQGLRRFGNDEAKAIAHADLLLKQAQASGLFSDRSAIERGSANAQQRQSDVLRLFTTLASYMFAKFNVAYERSRVAGRVIREDGVSLRSAKEAASWAIDMGFLFALEAVLYAAIKGRLPDEEDDEDGDGTADEWAQFMARETALSVASTIPFVRDLGGVYSGFSAGGAYGGITEELTRPLVQIGQGEADAALVKSIISATGLFTGLPAGQINRAVDAGWRQAEGEDVSPVEYLLGRQQ